MRIIVQDGQGNFVAEEDDGKDVPVPRTITPLQARIALVTRGKLDELEAWIAGQGQVAQIAWGYAINIERTSPIVAGAMQALGMTSEEMDDLFRSASEIVL